MDSNASSLLLCPPMNTKDETGVLIFDPSLMHKQPNLPTQFIWPNGDLVHYQDELKEPLIDLDGFLKADEVATAKAVELVRAACLNHGFFQVTNHGVDARLICAAHEEIDTIFKLPLDKKLSVRRKPGSVYGYSGAHADRYSSKLPWKETFSFGYQYGNNSELMVVDYFKSVLGDDFEHAG